MKFNYQARTKEGDIQAGNVEAASQEAALKVLQDYDLIVTFLEKAGEEPFYQRRLKIFERVTRKDLVLFSRELSIMFKSEVSLIEALRTIAEETKNMALKEKVLKIGEAVEGGSSLSEALNLFPDIFSPFYINMVRSGEVSGKLSETLEHLADHSEREYALLQKISGMMIYPAFILFTFTVVLMLMTILVIPKLVQVISAEAGQLPLVTRIVIAFSDILRKFFIFIVAFFLGLIFLLQRYRKTPEGKLRFDKFFLKLPLIGSLLKMIYLSRFAENLSTLISGGLPIAKALEVTAGVVGSQPYQEVILETKEEVRRGEMVSKTLRKYPDLFPFFFSQMVLVGEKTGRLSETLINVVSFYQGEIERSAEALLSLLEPILILVLGGAIGVLIAAVLLPLYQVGMSPTQ